MGLDDYTLNSRCVAVLLREAEGAAQLETFFSHLAAQPFSQGDYHETDSRGRRVEVVLHADWLVRFWTDHAVKQVHIVELEFLG